MYYALITTYRRPKELERLLASLSSKAIPVVFYPEDEYYKDGVKLPTEASGKGAGASRAWAMNYALKEKLSPLLILDDDCEDRNNGFTRLVEGVCLHKFGIVCKRYDSPGGEPPERLHVFGNYYKTSEAGVAWATSLPLIEEIGTINPKLKVREDSEFIKRALIAGKSVVQDRTVIPKHVTKQKGGLQALNVDRKLIMQEALDIIRKSYPENTLNNGSKFVLREEKLKKLQEDYRLGKLKLSSSSVKYIND